MQHRPSPPHVTGTWCRASRSVAVGRAYGREVEKEVAKMLNGEIARYRNEERVRQASGERISGPVAARRAEKRRAKIRSTSGLVVALLPFPFKH